MHNAYYQGYEVGSTQGQRIAYVDALLKLAVTIERLKVEKEFPVALVVNGTLTELYNEMSNQLLLG